MLSHEAVIDAAWDGSIKPLLLARFPGATPEELRKAHAYAYGGCIIQDMGYYPFGKKFFSDLVHYVRSGDFVEALIRESQDIDEYAFALGALAHYAADNNGHPIAVNLAVAIMYPKLRAKYGNDITYAENPAAHLKTEFGFDVVQVANGHYAPEAYHDFIGFEVAKPCSGAGVSCDLRRRTEGCLWRSRSGPRHLPLLRQICPADHDQGGLGRQTEGNHPRQTRHDAPEVRV